MICHVYQRALNTRRAGDGLVACPRQPTGWRRGWGEPPTDERTTTSPSEEVRERAPQRPVLRWGALVAPSPPACCGAWGYGGGVVPRK